MNAHLTGTIFINNIINNDYCDQIVDEFRNHEVLQEKTQHVSRFIALGKVGNLKKLKWIYAFNINPMVKTPALKLYEQPAGTTPCPYSNVAQEQTLDQRKVKKNLSDELDLVPYNIGMTYPRNHYLTNTSTMSVMM